MTAFPIIDLIAGMIFVYFLLSIVSSSLIEIVITGTGLRSRMLEKWLLHIFDKEITLPSGTKILLGQALMDHCGTTALSKKKRATSYIDAKNFTAALIEKITYDPSHPQSMARDMDSMIVALENTQILPEELKGQLIGYAHETKDAYKTLTVKVAGEIENFKRKIESWYDTNMERVGESLKMNYIRRITFWVAVIVTVCTNADSITIARYLYRHPQTRTEMAAQALAVPANDSVAAQVQRIIDRNGRRNQAGGPAADTAQIQRNISPTAIAMKQAKDSIAAQIMAIRNANAALEEAIPLGWSEHPFYTGEKNFSVRLVATKLAGLFMTVLAIMMGAPFWFDVLNKISNLRGSGQKPPTAAK